MQNDVLHLITNTKIISIYVIIFIRCKKLELVEFKKILITEYVTPFIGFINDLLKGFLTLYNAEFNVLSSL